MKTQAIGFDFDGVFVMDSENFKTEAWGKALAPYTGSYEPLLAEAHTSMGFGKRGGRVEIMRYVFEKLGEPEEKIPALVEEAAHVFDDYVQGMIVKAGLVPGALPMLQGLKDRGTALYLNSGTATSALKTSARNLQIESFFKGILGSTAEQVGGSKVENLVYIQDQEKADRAHMLVVGDGDSDVEAARKFGCRFIGVANRHNGWAEKPQEFDFVADLHDVLKYV